MPDPLKTAIQRQIASPESEFIASVLTDADEYDPWKPHTESYDLAVCIGPVSVCPPAKKRVLFLLGQTASHPDFDWDLVVVTSDKARKLALRKFGHGIKIAKLIPPVLNLNAGRRRLVSENRGLLHASEVATHPTPTIKMLNLWGQLPSPPVHCKSDPWKRPVSRPERWYDWDTSKPANIREAKAISLFTALEFNSLVRGGAIGLYPFWMQDGYDIQVRRHLALGGRVVCRPETGILGDYADLVSDISENHKLIDLSPVKPVEWKGTEQDYADGIKELIGRV